MILTSMVGGKLLLGKMSTGKVIGLSTISSELVGLITGTITYHYWDGKKKKSYTTGKKKKHKKRRW